MMNKKLAITIGLMMIGIGMSGGMLHSTYNQLGQKLCTRANGYLQSVRKRITVCGRASRYYIKWGKQRNAYYHAQRQLKALEIVEQTHPRLVSLYQEKYRAHQKLTGIEREVNSIQQAINQTNQEIQMLAQSHATQQELLAQIPERFEDTIEVTDGHLMIDSCHQCKDKLENISLSGTFLGKSFTLRNISISPDSWQQDLQQLAASCSKDFLA